MLKRRAPISLIVALPALSSAACNPVAPASELAAHAPEHVLIGSLAPEHAPVPLGLGLAESGITEAEFRETVDRVANLMRPRVEAQGATLEVDKDWSSTTQNAYARQLGTSWRVEMHGGLARMADMTLDALALVTCHEFGHHLAGYPFLTNQWPGAVEGQSDYFAIKDCARALWSKDSQELNAARGAAAPAALKADCDAAWSQSGPRAVCYREMAAAMALASTLAAMHFDAAPNPAQHDAGVVSETNENHPEALCRLDTYRASAVCEVEQSATLIPGLAARQAGQSDVELERASAGSACVNGRGARPLCWFHPLTDPSAPVPAPAPVPANDPNARVDLVRVTATTLSGVVLTALPAGGSVKMAMLFRNVSSQARRFEQLRVWLEDAPVVTDDVLYIAPANSDAASELELAVPDRECDAPVKLWMQITTDLGMRAYSRDFTIACPNGAG